MKQLKYIAILLLVATFGLGGVCAQGFKDVKINEILVKNRTSYTDDHSQHSSWIELYNSGYTSANIGGAYLEFTQGDKVVRYRIPKTDARTQIPPQGYVLFYASGASNKGTFHTNFSLNVTDSLELVKLIGINDTIKLLDQSGRNVVDFLAYDVNTQVPDVAYGRIMDDAKGEIVVRALESVTPLQSNEVHEKKPKSEVFRESDASGTTMSMIAMSVVFCALISLFLVFKVVGILMQKQAAAKKAKAGAPAAAATVKTESAAKKIATSDEDINGEVLAAISLALEKYYQELHDIESEIITINRVARVYSPWSSKIHTLTKLPRK